MMLTIPTTGNRHYYLRFVEPFRSFLFSNICDPFCLFDMFYRFPRTYPNGYCNLQKELQTSHSQSYLSGCSHIIEPRSDGGDITGDSSAL